MPLRQNSAQGWLRPPESARCHCGFRPPSKCLALAVGKAFLPQCLLAPAGYLAVEETSLDRRVTVRLEGRRASARSWCQGAQSLAGWQRGKGTALSHQECIEDGVFTPLINEMWGVVLGGWMLAVVGKCFHAPRYQVGWPMGSSL